MLLFACGVARVALVAVYLTLALTNPALASTLMVPFSAIVLLVAIYDARETCRRTR